MCTLRLFSPACMMRRTLRQELTIGSPSQPPLPPLLAACLFLPSPCAAANATITTASTTATVGATAVAAASACLPPPHTSVSNCWSEAGRWGPVYRPQVSSLLRVPNDTGVMAPWLLMPSDVEARIHVINTYSY